MLSRSSLPVVELGRFPPLFYLSVGSLLGVLIVSFVLGGRAEQKQAELLRAYGTSLAQISAQDVMDASVSNDLVAMHAIMQRVAAQPRVLRAAVHDLDQQLLVQAGQSTIREQVSQSFTAAIPLHDSVDGHVTVTLDAGFSGDAALKWTLTGTSLLLLVLAALAVYESRGVAWYFPAAPAEHDHDFSDEDEALVDELLEEASDYLQSENDSDQRFAADIIAADDADADVDVLEEDAVAGAHDEYDEYPPPLPPKPAAMHSDLIIALPNRARLEQQLNGERFLQLAWQFEQALDEVLALYGGTRVGANADASVVCVRFTSAESLAEAAFRAVCCAYLIDRLTRAPKVHFQLVAEVCHPDTDVKLAVNDAGIYMQKALADTFLYSRVETIAVNEERLRFEGFKGAYAPMLQRQLEQMQGDR